MIKKIIQIADVHIRNFIRHEEYAEQLEKLIVSLNKEREELEFDEMRILICGDVVHAKNTVSNELYVFVSSFLRELSTIAPVVVYTGNHDLLENNTTRIDTLTAVFNTADFTNVTLLDQLLSYKSGCVTDENVTWCLYSIHDKYATPNIEEIKKEYPNNVNIGLYHGLIVGAQNYNGTVFDNGLDGDKFSKCDIVMAGHIHMHQEFYRGDTLVVYSGSLIQKDFGETVTQHGYVSWNLENNTHEFVDIPNEYAMYDFEISTIEDIENDVEKLRNY
jgi:DNA repair exonuclease SbcCD nuclease subunit